MKKIVVSGGKGGVGKSVIAANLALASAKQGQRVVLFDADLQLANLDVILGLNPSMTLKNVVDGEQELADIFADAPFGVRVATGGSAVQGLMNAGPKRMSTFLSQIDDLSRSTDAIVFDTGAGLDNRVMTFLKLADEIVIVATPDPTSVMDAYATVKVLTKRKAEAPVRVLINQVQSESEGKHVFDALNGIVQHYLGRSLSYLGCVHQDGAVVESVRKRKPLAANYPHSQAAADLEGLARTLTQVSASQKAA